VVVRVDVTVIVPVVVMVVVMGIYCVTVDVYVTVSVTVQTVEVTVRVDVTVVVIWARTSPTGPAANSEVKASSATATPHILGSTIFLVLPRLLIEL
jgi:hypothetical protein